MDVVATSRNYILCKISAMNGKKWHFFFLYSEPQIKIGQSYLIIGDIK